MMFARRVFSAVSLTIIFGCGIVKHKDKDDENTSPEKPQLPYQLFNTPYADITDASIFLKAVRFSPDKKMFASAGLDGKIRVYDAETKKVLHVLETHNNGVYRIEFMKDSQHLVSSSPDKTIRIFDLNQGVGTEYIHHHAAEVKRFEFDSTVEDFALSPDESKVIAVIYGHGLTVVDIASSKIEMTIKPPVLPYTTPEDNSFRSVVYLPDGKSVISGNHRGIHQWDIATGKELREFKWSDNFTQDVYEINHVEVSSDGAKVVASSMYADRGFLVWEVATGNQVQAFNQFTASTPVPGQYQSDYKMRYCNIAKFTRDGTKLIGATADEIRVWDLVNVKELYRFSADSKLYGLIYDLDVSADGKYLMHTRDKTVRIWQLDGLL